MTVREHQALSIEARRWRYAGAREAAIYDELGWSTTRHAQVVNHLIDRPDVIAVYPQLTARLRRLRDARRAVRTRVA